MLVFGSLDTILLPKVPAHQKVVHNDGYPVRLLWGCRLLQGKQGVANRISGPVLE